MSERDDDVFDTQLRERWGAPPPPSPGLRARIVAAMADEQTTQAARRRLVFASVAIAATLIAVTPVGVGILHRHSQSSPTADELVWFDGGEEEDADIDATALFDLAELSASER